jgi:hypothetical protein
VVLGELFGGHREGEAAQGREADATHRIAHAAHRCSVGIEQDRVGHAHGLGGEDRLRLHHRGDLVEARVGVVGDALDAHRHVEHGGKVEPPFLQLPFDLRRKGLDLPLELLHLAPHRLRRARV